MSEVTDRPRRAPETMDSVPSPCIDVCLMDAKSGLCEGCLRTIDEVAAWSSLDDDAKRAVWALLDLRRESRESPAALPAKP